MGREFLVVGDNRALARVWSLLTSAGRFHRGKLSVGRGRWVIEALISLVKCL